MRAEEKIQNGKLVCIEVWPKDGRIGRVKITGDFFLHPEDAIDKLERSLIGEKLSISESDSEIFFKKALAKATLIGATSADLARIFRKAVSQ